jgi:hypothetical protein
LFEVMAAVVVIIFIMVTGGSGDIFQPSQQDTPHESED